MGVPLYKIRFNGTRWICSCDAYQMDTGPLSKRTCKHKIRYNLVDKVQSEAIEDRMKFTKRRVLNHAIRNRMTHYSEKRNGIYGRWRMGKMYTQEGIEVKIPAAMRKKLPKRLALDGEFITPTSRNSFGVISRAVNENDPEAWKEVRYYAYDIVDISKPYKVRYRMLRRMGHLDVIEQIPLPEKRWHEFDLLSSLPEGAEGIVLRSFDDHYSYGRSDYVIKMKNIIEIRGVTVAIEKRMATVIYKKRKIRIRVPKGNNVQKGDIIVYYATAMFKGKPREPVFIRAQSATDKSDT